MQQLPFLAFYIGISVVRGGVAITVVRLSLSCPGMVMFLGRPPPADVDPDWARNKQKKQFFAYSLNKFGR